MKARKRMSLISREAAIEAERQKIKASGSISRADAINAVLDLCKKCDSCYCGDCLVYAPNTNIYDVIDLLTYLPDRRWIPVSKTLPEEGVQVLVTDDAGGLATIDVDCGYFDEEYGRFEWFHSQNVTAWMPLPEPYRKDGD